MTPSVQPLQPPAKKKFPVWLIVILATLFLPQLMSALWIGGDGR